MTASLLLLVFEARWPAHAQVDSREGIALQNQIYQLRQDLKALEDQSARGGSRAPAYNPPAPQYGGSDIVAQLLTRVDALEDQVRQLRGRIDETQNQLQRQNDDLNKRIDDLAFQVNPQGNNPPPANEPAAGPPPRALPSQALPATPPPAARSSGPRTPEIALQEGNAALHRRDYQAAEAAAREVLANRTSPRAYDAQLLLAQALSGERQYAQAAIAYDDAYNRSRKGTHAQDALVGLANSLAAINEKKAACDTLTRLRTEFTQPRADIRDSEAVISQKAACR
ncbi:tetratricopeptide repeat protein [Rhodopila sp.]|uniref:tetratricopeptide repeat protein n=1 Tax=Rhodopila sp. TaxID=2480087 RepID=UPI003D0FEAD7